MNPPSDQAKSEFENQEQAHEEVAELKNAYVTPRLERHGKFEDKTQVEGSGIGGGGLAGLGVF